MHFLYTSYCMTFLANFDAMLSSQHHLDPTPPWCISQNPLLHMVLGKRPPTRGSYMNLKDQNEREDILLFRQLQLDLWAVRNSWQLLRVTCILPYRLRYLVGNSQMLKKSSGFQFENDPLEYLRLGCQCWLLWLAGDPLTFSRSFPDLCPSTSSNRYLRPYSTLKQLDLNT